MGARRLKPSVTSPILRLLGRVMRKFLLLLFAIALLASAGCSSPVATKAPVEPNAEKPSASQATTLVPPPTTPVPSQRPPAPAWADPYKGKLIVGVVTKEPVVALTIDDVGASDMKPLVDALVANDLHATLFCSGSEMTTEAAAYAAQHGIEVANHSWNHVAIGWYRPAAANAQIMQTAKIIEEGTGEWPLWYRAPFQGYKSQGRRAVAAAGMLAAGVSNDPLDYHGYTGTTLVKRISRRLKPGQIVLLHHYPQTIATFPAIAQELRRRGYQTLTMSELAQTGKPATSVWQLQPFARFFGH